MERESWTEHGGTLLPESERHAKYEAYRAAGFSDHEAREMGWPSESPDAETVTFLSATDSAQSARSPK